MMKIFKIAAFMPAIRTSLPARRFGNQTITANPQAGTPQVTKPMLEFANANSAKIAWTSKASQDLVVQWGTDPNSFGPLAADAIEKSGGDNHRATISNLQPNPPTSPDGRQIGTAGWRGLHIQTYCPGSASDPRAALASKITGPFTCFHPAF